MDTSARDCLVLFDATVTGRLDPGWRLGVLAQRVKSIRHGPMLDVECYPIWDTTRARQAREEVRKETHRRAQERLNRENAKKRLIRLVNANFVKGDLMVCCEYPDGQEPQSDEQARRDIVNYLKRIRYMREKRGLSPIKYIYITEVTVSVQYGVRYHHHVIMSGGISRAEAEDKWLTRHGGRCNIKRAQPDGKWLSGFACYLTQDKREREPEKDGKNPQIKAMRRGWNPSKNLMDPEKAATVADKKISIRKAQRIAEKMQDAQSVKAVFEKLWPDYELVTVNDQPEVTVRRSRWTAGVYITAQLRRRDWKANGKEDGGGTAVRRAAGERRAGAAVRVGRAAGGGLPGTAEDVPRAKRRKAKQD